MLLYKIVLSHELLCLGCICIDVSDSDTRMYMSDTGILTLESACPTRGYLYNPMLNYFLQQIVLEVLKTYPVTKY